MYCTKCGAQLNDEARFCSSCGTATTINVDPSASQQSASEIASSVEATTEKSPRSKLKYLIIGFACLLLASGILGATLLTMQVNSFFKLVEVKKYDDAKAKYSGISSDMIKKLVNKKIIKEINTIKKDFDNGKLSYNQVWELLNFYQSTDEEKTAKEMIDLIQKLSSSQSNMDFALEKQKLKDYFAAIPSFKKVIKEDKKNFSRAQIEVNNSIKAMYDYYLNLAQESSSKNDNYTSLKILKDLSEYYLNDDTIISRQRAYEEIYVKEVITQTDEKLKAADYYSALELIDKAIAVCKDKTALQKKREESVNTMETAEKLAFMVANKQQSPVELTNMVGKYHQESKIAEIKFTVKNVSKSNIRNITIKAAILDENQKEINSDIITIYTIPIGESKNETMFIRCYAYFPRFKLNVTGINYY